MANSGDVRAVTSSLNDVNDKIGDLLAKEKEIDNLIRNREVARDAGNHMVFANLDKELLESLAMIDDLERQIVAKLNKEIKFDEVDADRRMSFMLDENSDKTLENEMLNVKLNHSFDEFISLQDRKEKDIDSLNKQRENLEKRLQELEGQAIPDALEIGRTKREIEEINKKIEKLQKEVDKMRSIANIKDPQDIKNYIEKNNRIINNNFKNMKLKGIKEGNYAVATDLLRHLNDSDKMKAQYDHSSLLESQHEPFKNILTPQEFSYLSKMYEKQNGKPFTYNTNAKTGLLYNFFHRKAMKEILKARYPHLAKPENKDQLKALLKDKNKIVDGLAVLIQSGITPDMMRELHRDIELNIRNYQHNRGKREEWLNSIRLNNEPEQEQQKQPKLQPKSPERNDDAHKVSPQPQNSDMQNDIYTYLQQCGLSEQQIKGLYDILNRQQENESNRQFGSKWENDVQIRNAIDEIMQEDNEPENKSNSQHRKQESQPVGMDELPGVDFAEYYKTNRKYEEIHRKEAEKEPVGMEELPGVDFSEYHKTNRKYDEIHRKEAEKEPVGMDELPGVDFAEYYKTNRKYDEIHRKEAEKEPVGMDELPGVDFTEYDKTNQEYEEIHRKEAEKEPVSMDKLPRVDFTKYHEIMKEYEELHRKEAEQQPVDMDELPGTDFTKYDETMKEYEERNNKAKEALHLPIEDEHLKLPKAAKEYFEERGCKNFEDVLKIMESGDYDRGIIKSATLNGCRAYCNKNNISSSIKWSEEINKSSEENRKQKDEEMRAKVAESIAKSEEKNNRNKQQQLEKENEQKVKQENEISKLKQERDEAKQEAVAANKEARKANKRAEKAEQQLNDNKFLTLLRVDSKGSVKNTLNSTVIKTNDDNEDKGREEL